jgi:hypothetical protein
LAGGVDRVDVRAGHPSVANDANVEFFHKFRMIRRPDATTNPPTCQQKGEFERGAAEDFCAVRLQLVQFIPMTVPKTQHFHHVVGLINQIENAIHSLEDW